MIIQCAGCAGKYFLPQDKLPVDPMKVKCPQCRAVFELVPQHAEPVPAAASPEVKLPPAPAQPAGQAPPAADMVEKNPLDTPTTVAEPASAAPVAAAPAAPAAPKGKKVGKKDRDDARAERLARVLVSDIVMYNKEKRDQALVNGTLMASLSDEIKKSWELYKEKVGNELAKSTNYFKDALNEILADGQQVF